MSKNTTQESKMKIGDSVKTQIAPPHPAAFAGEITGIVQAGEGRDERAQVRNAAGEYRIITIRSLMLS